MDNKLSLHFIQRKTKSIFSTAKINVKQTVKLNMKHKSMEIKLHEPVTYA